MNKMKSHFCQPTQQLASKQIAQLEGSPISAKTQDALTAIACLTFFPAVYFIGRLIMTGFSSEATKVAESFFWL